MVAPRSWYSPIALIQSVIRPRFYGAAVAGALAVLFLPHGWPHTVRLALAWDIGGLVYLFFALHLMRDCGADRIRARAARRDEGRGAILFMILLAIAASFAAIGGLIGEAKLPTTPQAEKAWPRSGL